MNNVVCEGVNNVVCEECAEVNNVVVMSEQG